ncbi:MAG: YicC/YloC family endoribonuclease, partial [Candidatus Aminicenantia bacterium]
MKSMTGFVQEKFGNESMVLYITIKSFNSRTLDIYLKTNLPYAEIEKRAFQTIRKYINRGRVECFINILPLKYEQMEIFLNKPALLKILNELKSIGENPNLLFLNMAEIPG